MEALGAAFVSVHSSAGCLGELKRLCGAASEEGLNSTKMTGRGKEKKAVSQGAEGRVY